MTEGDVFMIKVVLIGAGNRGETYTSIMHEYPEKFQVVAVADPVESRREYVKKMHNIPQDLCFDSYQKLFEKGKIADIAVIATQDRMHYEPTMQAISLKYDILLEKPISPSAQECVDVMLAAHQNHVLVIVCTVLRYTPLFGMLKDIIDSGRIGKVISINHEECVGNVHQSHSFVRGNWGNAEKSSGMLLAKSCHDVDLLAWLAGERCLKIQSFGSLSYFTEENAPKGAPERCIDGCTYGDSCPYNAVKLYLDDKDNYWFRSTSTLCQVPTDEDVEKVLRTKQYGKCVYRCDNDVVDHQTVNMLFASGATATFTMCAFNRGGRFIHVMGTAGEVRAELSENGNMTIYDFATKETSVVPIRGIDGIDGGHGGGDTGIVQALYEYIEHDVQAKTIPTIEESCYNHMLVFAAEASRKSGQVVNVAEYLENFSK